ncbi:MAG: biopolymer transporter ExbD [Halofilum sp. (in: g-proteobacteria)]|nr:biopolymer transporter ExbD [Halofilum sp. (in: g-proteobacteria)]
MKRTRRIQRMQRASRGRKTPGFNLTALMDIFTILVFFLLVNSSTAEQLPDRDNLELPESIAEQKPEQTIIVMVTRDRILVQGRPVADVESVLQSGERTVPAVSAELQAARERVIGLTTRAVAKKDQVTIMGDREAALRLLRKLMQSCTQVGYTSISLAVIQKARQNEES